MKKLTIILSALFLFLGASFAYTPSTQDQSFLTAFQNKLTSIISPNSYKNPIIADQVKLIKNKYRNNERIFYLFGEIENFIRYYGQETTDENNENNTINNTNNNTNICQQNIKDYLLNNNNQNSISNYNGETILVESEQELRDAINSAKNRGTLDYTYDIVIKAGTYTLSNGFRIDTDNLIIRGETGNPENVILQGAGMNGGVSHIFWIIGDDIRIGDMTIGNVANHAIQIQGERDADKFLAHNLNIFDTNEQMIKGSTDHDHNYSSENGIIQCSKFSYTAGIGPQYYIGGIDIHFGQNRLVRNNEFYDITSPESRLAEHAIHFRSDSSNITVENNKIINCDRGIGFGLGDSQHNGGSIHDNQIYHDASKGDVGIGLESASNIDVYNNTIFFDNTYANAIEYRFSAAQNNKIHDNKTNKNIQQRNDGQAELYNNTTITNNPINY